jgi:hypothetical protein
VTLTPVARRESSEGGKTVKKRLHKSTNKRVLTSDQKEDVALFDSLMVADKPTRTPRQVALFKVMQEGTPRSSLTVFHCRIDSLPPQRWQVHSRAPKRLTSFVCSVVCVTNRFIFNAMKRRDCAKRRTFKNVSCETPVRSLNLRLLVSLRPLGEMYFGSAGWRSGGWSTTGVCAAIPHEGTRRHRSRNEDEGGQGWV